MKVLLNNRRNINSVNKDIGVNVQLSNNKKILDNLNILHQVNTYSVFENERNACTSYRLILTIKPICTNILFNPLTILLSGDQSTGKRVIDATLGTSSWGSPQDYYTHALYEPTYTTYRDYTYLCGYNIFDMFLFRSDLFKKSKKLDDKYDVNFKIYYKGEDYYITKHVYTMDDIISFPLTIKKHLTEKNGWVGFTNPSKLTSDSTVYSFLSHTNICDFIDLYPTMDLFSFKPKYREINNREENNWDVILTYPFKSFNDNFLVKDKPVDIDGTELTGIPVINQESNISLYGKNIVTLKLAYKHNLNINDKIRITYLDGGKYEKPIVTVYNIKGNSISIDDSKYNLHNILRVEKVIDNNVSKYYFRIFKKIPNWKFAKEEITDTNVMSRLLDTPLTDFTNTSYQLGFASTIYGDDIHQYTFTDNIDINHLTDNLGRPLTEIYTTIIKRNQGYDLDKEFVEDNSVEYSHCFGSISSAFPLTKLEMYDTLNNYNDYSCINYIHNINNLKSSENVSILPNEIEVLPLPVSGSEQPPSFNYTKSPYHMEVDITKNGSTNGVLSYDNQYVDFGEGTFLGDIVEFNDSTCEEVILEDALHRFNTVQRESGKTEDRILRFHEIITDDGDKDLDFLVQENNWTDYNPLSTVRTYTRTYNKDAETTCKDGEEGKYFIYRGEMNVNPRPEGYFYKPHYKIKLKNWSNIINQAYFKQIPIKDMGKEDDTFMFLLTHQRHGKINGDKIRVINSSNGLDMIFNVNVSSKDFYKLKIELNDALLNSSLSDITVWDYNDSVPQYAINMGNGRFIWKDILKEGETENIYEEPLEHVFTNGNLYLNEDITFLLRRQDPFGENGLIFKDFPNDIYGNKLNVREYEAENVNEIC